MVDLSTDNVDDLLRSYAGWLFTVARNLVSDENLIPDLANEGMVAMWRATKDWNQTKGPLDYWLKKNAHWRMLDCARSQAWLGRPPRHRGGHSKVDDRIETVVEPESVIWGELEQIDVLDYVHVRYHAGEIGKAVSELTPAQQKYVRMRFWEGKQAPELKEEFGYDPRGLWSSPKNGAKKKLAEKLGYLAELIS